MKRKTEKNGEDLTCKGRENAIERERERKGKKD